MYLNTVSAQQLNWFYRLALLAVIVSLPLQGLAVAVERLGGMFHTHRPMLQAQAPILVELDLSVLHHDLPSKRRVHAHPTPPHGHADAHRHHHDAADQTVVISAQSQAAELTANATSSGKRVLIDLDGATRFALPMPAHRASSLTPRHKPQGSSSVDPRRLERPPRLA